MDDELRSAFATLSAQIADVGSDARAAASRAQEAAHAAAQVAARADRLEKHVFGSDPPPPLPIAPVVRRMSESEGDIDDLSGQIIAVRGELAAVKAINEEQSKKLGLEASGLLGALRSATAKDVIKLVTLAMAVYAALHGSH